MRIVMKFRCLLAALALTVMATDSMAGPSRRRAQPVYQPTYQSPTYMPSAVTQGGEYVSNYSPSGVYVSSETPVAATVYPGTSTDFAGLSAGDGLDDVNAKRAAAGLRPFVRDEALTQAAR